MVLMNVGSIQRAVGTLIAFLRLRIECRAALYVFYVVDE